MRCNGVTRVGKRCSVTNSSKWTDDQPAKRASQHPEAKVMELLI